MALKPEAFQKCFQDWIAHAIRNDHSGSDRLIAIDGKTCRGSHDASQQLGPLHIVSAWASEEGIALGQVATEEKSNETRERTLEDDGAKPGARPAPDHETPGLDVGGPHRL
jgi:hypothetical protein